MVMLLAVDIVPTVAIVSLNIFGAAMAVTMVRLLKGPSLPDRVVALDLIAVLAAGVIAVYAILTHEPMLLRAAIVVALVAFVGTVAFAMFLERRGKP
jgi:multicomponent Na+:H+ antiporter subunit F